MYPKNYISKNDVDKSTFKIHPEILEIEPTIIKKQEIEEAFDFYISTFPFYHNSLEDLWDDRDSWAGAREIANFSGIVAEKEFDKIMGDKIKSFKIGGKIDRTKSIDYFDYETEKFGNVKSGYRYNLTNGESNNFRRVSVFNNNIYRHEENHLSEIAILFLTGDLIDELQCRYIGKIPFPKEMPDIKNAITGAKKYPYLEYFQKEKIWNMKLWEGIKGFEKIKTTIYK